MKCLRHWPWLLLVPALIGLARLRFDTDVLNLLPSGVAAVDGVKVFQKNFPQARELIVTLQAPDAEVAETAARSLAATLRSTTDVTAGATWQPPWLEHPDQSGELVAYLWLNQPPEVFAQMAARLSPEHLTATVTDVREQLATSISPSGLGAFGYDPFGLLALPESARGGISTMGQGQEMFASADGSFRLVFVQPLHRFTNYRECVAWVGAVQALVEKWRVADPLPGLVVRYTGGPAIEAEISNGMQNDMAGSICATAIIIGILFWLSHRRLVPMLWLLVLLGIILGTTLALGGLIFGVINVVSLGFAGILLGLAVDYGVVHYQEAIASPNAIIPEIRRAIGPSIFWAAVTTISAFLMLNISGLPGLAQLGSLVALGVTLSALVMLYAFLPPLFRDRTKRRIEQIKAGFADNTIVISQKDSANPPPRRQTVLVFWATGLLLVVIAIVLSYGLPELDQTSQSLRPRHSAAYAALDEIRTHLTKGREPLWLLTTAHDEAAIAQRLKRIEPLLQRAVADKSIASFLLPTALWPQPEHQAANRKVAAQVVSWQEALHSAATTAGFSSDACTLADRILDTWKAALADTKVFWPTNASSRWVMDKIVAHKDDDLVAIGLVTPNSKEPSSPQSLASWAGGLEKEGFAVCGWELLGSSVLQHVRNRIPWVVLPMIVLILASLWLAFGRPAEILLSIGVLVLSGLSLLALMRVAGWSWNLLNLMALPLMLGAGVDYSIFMQLALRRHRGNLSAAHHSVGRALLLCGGTAMAGFGSLAWSTNAGIASLGAVCAAGIGLNMFISVCLLPVWWRVVLLGSAINTREPDNLER